MDWEVLARVPPFLFLSRCLHFHASDFFFVYTAGIINFAAQTSNYLS